MGHLTLVRHAQASFFGASYDQLSALGETQATALGDHWARHGKQFQQAFVGPRKRHRQTYDLVSAAYQRLGAVFPQASELPGLDEHHGGTVIKHALGRTDAHTDSLGGQLGEVEKEQAILEFYRHYDRVMREWAQGVIEVPGVETWASFRARTLETLNQLCNDMDGGGIVAFTSGGFIASAAGWLLGTDEDRVIDLSIVLKNTAQCDVSWSKRRRSLVSFNLLPHLPTGVGVTSV